MSISHMKALLVSVLAVTAVLATVACASEDEGPTDVQLDLAIRDGKLNLEDDTIRVKQGDNVTFNITSDQAGGFHLHGYNFVTDVGPDAPGEMKFEADATGRFEIRLHPFGAEHGENDEGEHMEGGDGELMEKIRMLEDELHHIHMERREHAIMELNEHRDHIEEELAHMREEHARMAEHMQEMEEEAKRVAEELERIHSEPMDEPPMDEPPE